MRLGVAALAGAALGLNRDLHGKPTGVRTLGLVGTRLGPDRDRCRPTGEATSSRVMQGIVTGIGFLGAGVIIRGEKGKHVHNLTTAACVRLYGMHRHGLRGRRVAAAADWRVGSLPSS